MASRMRETIGKLTLAAATRNRIGGEHYAKAGRFGV